MDKNKDQVATRRDDAVSNGGEGQLSTPSAQYAGQPKAGPLNTTGSNKTPRTGRAWWLLTHGLPMYGIVLTLLFIAVQPLIVPLIKEWRQGSESGTASRAKVAGGTTTQSTGVLTPAPADGSRVVEDGTAAAGRNTSAPAASSNDDARSVGVVARLSLDATKERIDGMKETYDRLFAMIATLGALLAFLGFKGFESFLQAKDDAQETVDRSKSAVREAEAAKAQADAALKELHQFLRVDYPKDNSAEINVAHGLVMREIASLYACMAEKLNKDIKDFPEYREVLLLTLVYLNKVRAQADRLDKRVVARALITIGNVEAMLGNFRGALEACSEVIEKHSPDDESAHFNAACYACRLGAEEASKESHKTAKTYADLAIARLTRAIELLPSNRRDAATDKDFAWLREQKNPAFMSLLAEF